MIEKNEKELNNAKVLIVGAAGFIGGFLVKEILKESVKEVILYDNFTRELDITNNYVQARTSALRDAALRERDFGQNCLDRVTCIKKFIGADANKITQGQLLKEFFR